MGKRALNVSGIITTFKRKAEVVESAIKSMIAQTYPLKEIIVVDDNYNDSDFCAPIKELCAKYDIVKYIKQDGNKGACAARNLGIKNAISEYIGFLDDDDEWLPEKTEKQIEVFEKNADCGLVFCNGIVRKESSGENSLYNSSVIVNPTFYDILAGDKIGSTSNPLIKKSVFDDLGGFWEEQPARQDYEMWIRISQKYKIIGIKDALFIHTIHDGEQISKSSKKAYIGYKNIYKKYKKYYKKNPIAENYILNQIRGNHQGFSFAYALYLIRACRVKLKLKFRIKKQDNDLIL